MDRKEKLQEYALYAEIIGAVCIVASLLFVGAQVSQGAQETHQNTLQMQADAYQQLTMDITSLNVINIEFPEVLFLATTTGNLNDLDPLDRQRVWNFLVLIIRMSDTAYHQFEQHIIPELRLNSAMAPLKGVICFPTTQQVWSEVSNAFVTSYQAQVREYLSECPVPAP